MSLGPFLRRELILSVRGERAFNDRRNTLLLALLGVASCFVLWDQRGWDRASVVGGYRFGMAVFGLLVVEMVLMASGTVLPQVALAIASERDRKSLDALLASRFAGAEIVLGTMAAGLFRFLNVLAAAMPVVVLVMFLGGVAPGWVILAGIGLASSTLLMAAIGAWSSVGAKTGVHALNSALGLYWLWNVMPLVVLMVRPRIWPGAPSWLTSAVFLINDGTLFGLVGNLSGMFPRPGGAVEGVLRMAGWQLACALALAALAIVRLRPASRGLHDVEGQETRLQMLRAAIRRPPRRPPCSDDPVLWYQIHATRGVNAVHRFVGRAWNLILLAGLAAGMGWFAVPAFAELAERGYHASREAFRMPEMQPIVRLMVRTMFSKVAIDPAPGQARLEFNIALRVFTGMFAVGFAVTAFTAAFESIKGELRRDTWLGLIATPLSGPEILRGKTLGTLWKAKEGIILLIVLWTVGLLAGSVHPLGFLAALAFLAASAAFFPAQGLSVALKECSTRKPLAESMSTVYVPILLGIMAVMTIGPVVLAWAMLLTFEDVEAILHGGPFIQFGEAKIREVLGARAVFAAVLTGVGGFALAGAWLIRANNRGFDQAVGRPVRPEG